MELCLFTKFNCVEHDDWGHRWDRWLTWQPLESHKTRIEVLSSSREEPVFLHRTWTWSFLSSGQLGYTFRTMWSDSMTQHDITNKLIEISQTFSLNSIKSVLWLECYPGYRAPSSLLARDRLQTEITECNPTLSKKVCNILNNWDQFSRYKGKTFVFLQNFRLFNNKYEQWTKFHRETDNS